MVELAVVDLSMVPLTSRWYPKDREFVLVVDREDIPIR